MKIVRIQYQVRENFVQLNKMNLHAMMSDLQSNPIEGMHYSIFYLGDGRFMHLNSIEDEEAEKELSSRDTYRAFLMGLDASDPLAKLTQEDMDYVGSNVA
jgi:hypothetical protein